MNQKRKHIHRILTSILLSMFLLPACNDDFMERYPLSGISDANYFTSTNDLRLYVNRFYPNLSALNGYRDDNLSDNQVSGAGRDAITWDEYTLPVSGGGWAKGDWENIRNCNYFLQRFHTVEGDRAEIRRYLGEILFFKSLFYYDKVTRFGDVPWLDRDMQTNSEELYLPRTSRKVVMDSVCANLDRAIRYLPEEITQDRLSRYAALALKSRVCLFEGTFRKYHALGDHEKMLRQAADAAWEVIESAKFKMYSTRHPETDVHDFFQLHYDDMKESGEAIFYVNYVLNSRMHNRVRECREFNSGMSKDFAESFLCRTTGLPIALSGDDYKGDATFDDEFVNRDYRMKNSIYTSDQPYLIRSDGSVVTESTPIISTLQSTGYRMYKMMSALDADNEPYRCVIADAVYRYGEVLLNYAEAKAELGECDQTVVDQTINLLRDRVAMPRMTVPIAFVDPNWPEWEVAPDANHLALINEIRRERRVELASEGFRFNDLRRWKAGKLLNNPKTYLGARNPNAGNEYHVVYPGYTRVWNDRCYLYPIPTEEFVLNPNLGDQNPGWSK